MTGRLPIRAMMFAAAALALGGGTVLLSQTHATANATGATPDAPVIGLTTILVATRQLPAGTVVKSGDLAWRPWPTTALDRAYIVRSPVSRSVVSGGILRTAVGPGEPMTAERLVATGSPRALAAITTPGSRAVSISLTPTSGVSGLIVPGDRVDVILTYALPRPADGGGGLERRAATTILSDVRVLAVDQRLSGAAGDTKDIHNASLEVTAKQSEILALAADLGKLSLSLRGIEPAPGNRVAIANNGTLDYQVGRFLPGLRSSAVYHPRAASASARPAAAASSPVEFHGGKASTAGASQ